MLTIDDEFRYALHNKTAQLFGLEVGAGKYYELYKSLILKRGCDEKIQKNFF